MNRHRFVILAAVVLMGAGIWLVVKPDNNNDGSAPATAPDESAVAGEGAPAAPNQTPGTTQPPTGESPVFTMSTIAGLPIETVPTVPPVLPDWVPDGGLVVYPIDETGCVPDEAGYGVEMRAWGDVMLPYALGWPTNTPGEPPNCAPDTPFGAAIVAAHTLYLDALNPLLIPTIGDDTPGRQIRIENHPGPMDPATLGMTCEVLGWAQASFRNYRIYSRCGDGPVKATTTAMTRKGGRWLLVYPANGEHPTRDAQPGEGFYPFEGGH